MRILDANLNKALKNITVYLTPDEAGQMLGYLEDLIAGKIHHAHINDETYEREIILVLCQLWIERWHPIWCPE